MYIKLPMDLWRPCVRNAFDTGKSITWASGRGLGPGNLNFLGPKWRSLNSWMPFHRAQKNLDFQGPTLLTGPRNGFASIKIITHGAV